ncbi:cytochrome-c peroxidase [Pararobbsia silviterrae]|uniref:Cytochrome-c peroxidase n=1 Tax=Pararobbsia silviterrae TaxID=1792498 RepID=A0A494XLZ4_9BURK|nr:cytochrome c peroxidase [Pararobbsia silviterrae]RKP49686.1 cytochrome-c peroxidase [Pararobbsia silviterrae]
MTSLASRMIPALAALLPLAAVAAAPAGTANAASAAPPALVAGHSAGASAPAAVSVSTHAGTPALSDAAALGKHLFFDPALSGSGKMSCATCHSPEHAYGPPNGLAAQLGGPDLREQGTRAVPSLRYTLNNTPVWSHARAASLTERLEDPDNAPVGGFGWDGRFNHLHDQAVFPLFAPNEMANKDAATLLDTIAHASYAPQFKAVFGEHVFADPGKAFADAMQAIERFELEDPSFHPYTSKFDYYLDGKVQLTARELRGKKLFDDPKGGNCASCHIDQSGADGSHPMFTDFNFQALGVPRNRELRLNADPTYYDLGLCGPIRTDQSADRKNCGLFKDPSLRNTATRHVFFHNGRFHTLKDAVRFYVERDTQPEKWYPKDRHGNVVKFDDVPAAFRVNIDTTDEPLTRKRGDKPVWDERDIDDVVAFLETLNDDYREHDATGVRR